MIPPLAAIAQGFFVAVAGAAAFVWLYNRTLAQLHESMAKKILAVAGLPVSVLPGLAVWCCSAVGRELPGPATAWNLATAAGAAITACYVVVFVLKAWRERETRFARVLRAPAGSFDRARLPWWGRPFAFFVAPINGVVDLRIRRHVLRVADLAPEFDGYRIVHVTDWHIHKTLSTAWYAHVAAEARALRPDAILFGGDCISKLPHVPRIPKIARMFRAPDGVWYVRGNHDFWKAPQRIARLAREGGMKLLSNEGVVVRRGDAAISLVGLECPYVSLVGSERDAIERLPHPRIAVVHAPEAFREARDLGCAAAFAGHTHGGQVRLPLFGTTLSGTAMGPLLADGAGRLGRMLAVTSNGVGAFFPIRVLCPPEIVLLELRRG